MTPRQVLEIGAFGGTYFRPIYSGVLKQNLKDAHLQFGFSDFPAQKVTSSVYQESVNYYKVKCGASLQFWESKNWIKGIDPYGWFQWYCRFFFGRRSYDDSRQVKRWLNLAGPKGRFSSRRSKSNKVKQVLIHWAVWC